MIKFNPDNKEVLTYAECLKPAMEIMDQADANQYLVDYIAYIQAALEKEPRSDEMTAEEIAKINLGYYAGYYNSETRKRVELLFCCHHPIFGSASQEITTQEAYEAGIKQAPTPL